MAARKKLKDRRLAKILIIQGGPAKEDPKKNLKNLIHLMDAGCEKENYDYVCFSELAAYKYFAGVMDIRYLALAEPIPGPTTDALSEKAQEYSTNIVLPVFEKGKVRGEFYNSTVIIGRDGNLIKGTLQDDSHIHCYRKVQVPLRDKEVSETYYFRRGPGYVVFDTDLAKIGTLICHDRSYPEGWRVLALMGAEIIFLGVNTWPKRRRHAFLSEISTMAIQNGYFVVVSSKGGVETAEMKRTFIGKSAIISPMGEILAEGPEDKGWILVSGEIDLDDVEQYHRTYHYFRDRRPELYGMISRHNI
ncbi:MAG: carbon-nitrogen hydrolase family protein [Pseudomonadota bacterium]